MRPCKALRRREGQVPAMLACLVKVCQGILALSQRCSVSTIQAKLEQETRTANDLLFAPAVNLPTGNRALPKQPLNSIKSAGDPLEMGLPAIDDV